MTDITTLIISAISTKKLITLRYSGSLRTVEPFLIGYDTKKNLVLSAWQTSGQTGTGWREFLVAKISELAIIDAHFAGNRPGYNRADPRIPQKLARI